MTRDRRIARIAPLIAIGALLILGSEAFASEGELVLFPHVHGEFSFRDLIILLVLFTALVYPVNRLIFKPIFRVLDEREEKIAGTRRQADRLFAEADEVLERYEQSLREVRQDAEQERKQTLEGARADGAAKTAIARGEAEREVTRAREEVAAALDDARGTLRAQSESLASEIAARVLGRVLS
jgi:F-type H+-transporting ATPase subunit b